MSIAQQLNAPSYRLEGFSFHTDADQPQQYATHQHTDVEIALILNQASAKVQWQNGDHRYHRAVDAGHLCIIPSEQPHSVGWDKAAEYIMIFVHPTQLQKVAQDCATEYPFEIRGQYGIRDPLIQSLAMILRSSFQSEGTVEHLYIDTLINTLILYLLKKYAGCQFIRTSEQAISSHRWLKEVLDYINQSLDQDLRLAKLANIAKMSESSFCHLFKEYMNISPHQYVISERITRAKELLLKREQPISDIALACGFNSQSHLTAYFRRHTGVTPKVYQRMSF